MINANHLYHMYQSWCQGIDDPSREWSFFVEWAAKMNGTTGDEIMRVLQTTYWFKKPE